MEHESRRWHARSSVWEESGRETKHGHSLETGPPPSGQLNAGVRRREGLARRPYPARTRAEILARVSIRLVVN